MEFLKCKHCENVVGFVKNVGNEISCCGEAMDKLIANTTDASVEKHVPTYKKEGNYIYVSVGDVLHPYTEEHHIEWVALVTRKGNQRKVLNSQEKQGFGNYQTLVVKYVKLLNRSFYVSG